MSATLYTDGGARGNPGPAGIGYVLTYGDGEVVEHGEYIGEATNNVAEYTALLMGLEKALSLEVKELDCYLDSELVVKQLRGEYRVKQPDLRILFESVKKLTVQFEALSFTHVRREKNKIADRMVNEALDSHAAHS